MLRLGNLAGHSKRTSLVAWVRLKLGRGRFAVRDENGSAVLTNRPGRHLVHHEIQDLEPVPLFEEGIPQCADVSAARGKVVLHPSGTAGH